MTQENKVAEYSIDLNEKEPIEIEQVCSSCGENGILRLLLLPDLFFPDALVTSFSCIKCGYKDKQMDQIDNPKKGVKIKCVFREKADLKRYVVLSSGAEVKIESENKSISFTQNEDSILVTEGLIRTMLEKLVSCEITPENPLTQEEMEKLNEYKETAEFLQKSLDDLDLTLEIKDEKGVSRVLPRNEPLEKGTKSLPLDYFRDGIVAIEDYEIVLREE